MSSLTEVRPSGEDRGEERAENVVRVANNGGEQPTCIFCRVNQRVESLTLGREVAQINSSVDEEVNSGSAYIRRARTVALVTSWREEVGNSSSPWFLGSSITTEL